MAQILKAVFTTLSSTLSHELDVFLGFTWRDWSTTLIPGSILSIGAMRTLPPSLNFLWSYLFLILWLAAFVYFFNLSNQITGVEEDRIDKPDRPIPSGKVTIAGARIRWIVALAVFISAAIYNPTLRAETICWILTTALLCATPFGKHWFVKNSVAMTTGTWALLNASWKIIAPLTPSAERYLLAVSVWTGILMPVQDLRDMKGDAAIGRQTLPLVVGNSESRQILTFLFIPVSLAVLQVGGIFSIAPIPAIAVHMFLGYRIMQDKGSFYDHKTYMVFTYIFCLVLAFIAFEGLEWSGTVRMTHNFLVLSAQ